MKSCTKCKAILEHGEDLFCSPCMIDGRQLKKILVKEWKVNIKDKLDIVKTTIKNVQEDVDNLQEECE